MEQQNKMGTAKMGPLIFSMALPAMISMIINALYNIVDSIFVAKYSQDALAAVSLVYPIQMLVVAIGVGTGVGVNSLIARRLGEKRQEEADSAAEHGVALAVVGGIVFLVLGLTLKQRHNVLRLADLLRLRLCLADFLLDILNADVLVHHSARYDKRSAQRSKQYHIQRCHSTEEDQ